MTDVTVQGAGITERTEGNSGHAMMTVKIETSRGRHRSRAAPRRGWSSVSLVFIVKKKKRVEKA